MENFSNETLDTAQLPRFEQVPFTALQPSYWKVLLANLLIAFVVVAVAVFFIVFNAEEVTPYILPIVACFAGIFALTLFFTRIGFRKKAFAFRNHDVLFRHGIIATNTIVIPYNRVQHVALHEGIISRYFGLATVEIFTAGGSSSDIAIPGIAKEQAENIKQLLMGKIQKQL